MFFAALTDAFHALCSSTYFVAIAAGCVTFFFAKAVLILKIHSVGRSQPHGFAFPLVSAGKHKPEDGLAHTIVVWWQNVFGVRFRSRNTQSELVFSLYIMLTVPETTMLERWILVVPAHRNAHPVDKWVIRGVLRSVGENAS